MNSFTDWQISTGADAGAALTEVNTLAQNVGSRVFEKDTNIYLLLEAIPGETTPNSVIHVFRFGDHCCAGCIANPSKCYAGIGNQA